MNHFCKIRKFAQEILPNLPASITFGGKIYQMDITLTEDSSTGGYKAKSKWLFRYTLDHRDVLELGEKMLTAIIGIRKNG